MEAIAIAGKSVLGGIDPAGVVTVGTRELKHGWTIFFNNPRKRPFESFPLTLARSDIDVRAEGGYTKVIVGGAAAGPFSGTYEFTIYPGSRLVRAAMVMTTQRPATAYTRSEEPTSELQSLMRLSYAVFCLKTKTQDHTSSQI